VVGEGVRGIQCRLRGGAAALAGCNLLTPTLHAVSKRRGRAADALLSRHTTGRADCALARGRLSPAAPRARSNIRVSAAPAPTQHSSAVPRALCVNCLGKRGG
jgi:hypothetical protein